MRAESDDDERSKPVDESNDRRKQDDESASGSDSGLDHASEQESTGDEASDHDASDDDGEGDDSDTETQRFSESAHRFACRCVKAGEFSKALGAVMKVVELSDLASVASRQALLLATQILSVLRQEDRARTCLLEIWTSMPPPYTTQDAQLYLAMLYERTEQAVLTKYWITKALGVSASIPTLLDTWRRLGDKAYDHSDLIFARDAYTKVFNVVTSSLQAWPGEALLALLPFVSRFLTTLVSVGDLRLDYQYYCQSVALELAIVLMDSGEQQRVPPIQQRVVDLSYLRLRHVYFESFPALYHYLFEEEDWFVGRISRAWRVFQARRTRRRMIQDRERERAEAALTEAATKKPQCHRKEKALKKPAPPLVVPRDLHDSELEALRRKTKARVESLRRSPSKRLLKASSPSNRQAQPVPNNPSVSITSPTRRRLELVKRHRVVDAVTEDPPTPCEERPSSADTTSTLLDIYSFPRMKTHRQQFIDTVGRPQGAADLDTELEEIEAFARMAHYRSRVIAKLPDVKRLEELHETKVAPEWLRRLNHVLEFIQENQRQQSIALWAMKSHFSQIHTRVVLQLTNVHQNYVLQHGKTMFTVRLMQLIKRLETWQLVDVDQDIVRSLEAVRAIGEQEEAHRNLEFFHVRQEQKT